MVIRRLRLTTLCCLILACLWLAQPLPLRVTTAQTPVAFEIFTPFAGQYVVGTWLPLRVTLRNQGSVAATVTVTATPAEGSARYARTLQLAAGSQQTVWLYAFLAQPVQAVIVTLAIDGVIAGQQEVLLLLRPVDRMRAVVGPSPVSNDLFAAGSLQVADLPDHPLGLSSVSVLALFELDQPLSTAQQTAILAWVYGGGHLIIGGGPTAVGLQANLPPALHAAAIEGAALLDRQPLITRGAFPLDTPLLGLKLAPAAGAQSAGTPPAWVEYAVGRGRVTQLAFAPEALAGWAGREPFWTALAQPVLLVEAASGISAQIAPRQLQTLAPVFDALPQIAIPAFAQGLVALTWYAFAIVLLGLGFWRWRREVPAMMLAFVALMSAGAGLWWANAHAAPAYSALRMTLLELIDDERAQAQTVTVMLSAMPRTETIGSAYPAISRPLAVAGSGGVLAGGVDSVPQMATQITLALAPWQMQGLWTTAIIPAPPVRAVLVVDQGRLRVDVQNDSQYTLRDVFVVYGDQLLFFGTLRPGARSVARWPALYTSAMNGVSLGQLVINDLRDHGLLVDRGLDRTAQIRAALVDAAVAALPERFDPGPFMLAWLDRDPAAAAQPMTGQVETLLVMRPPIRGQGELSLPVGWLRLDLAGSAANPCLNGQGMQVRGENVEIRLRLPPALSSLQASTIRVQLNPVHTTSVPNLTVRVYNWATGGWDAVPFNLLSNIAIATAEPYLRSGEVRLRLSGALEQLGCVMATGGVQGVLP